MQNTDSIAQLVTIAAKAKLITAPNSLALRIPPGPQVWPAQVVTRWAGGCHVRVAGEHDTILPADALPQDAESFGIRVIHGGLVVFRAA